MKTLCETTTCPSCYRCIGCGYCACTEQARLLGGRRQHLRKARGAKRDGRGQLMLQHIALARSYHRLYRGVVHAERLLAEALPARRPRRRSLSGT